MCVSRSRCRKYFEANLYSKHKNVETLRIPSSQRDFSPKMITLYTQTNFRWNHNFWIKWIFPNKIIFSIIFSIKLHFHNFNNDIRISPNPTYKVFSKNTTSHVYSPIIFFQPKNLSISNLKVSRIERKSIISSKDVHNLSARSVKTCEDIVGYDKTHTFDRTPKRWWFAMGVETKTNKRTSILSVPDCRRGSGRRRRRDGTARYNAIKTQPWKLTEISGKGVVKVTVVYFVPRVNYWR